MELAHQHDVKCHQCGLSGIYETNNAKERYPYLQRTLSYCRRYSLLALDKAYRWVPPLDAWSQCLQSRTFSVYGKKQSYHLWGGNISLLSIQGQSIYLCGVYRPGRSLKISPLYNDHIWWKISDSIRRVQIENAYSESKRKAFTGASALLSGAGIRSTTAWSTASTPFPVFAEICSISAGSIPKVDWICAAIRSGCEAGRSILYKWLEI